MRADGSLWGIVILLGLCASPLILVVQKYRRTHLPK